MKRKNLVKKLGYHRGKNCFSMEPIPIAAGGSSGASAYASIGGAGSETSSSDDGGVDEAKSSL